MKCNRIVTNGKRRFFPLRLVFALILIFSISPLFAQRKITVKMASLVPRDTPWGKYLDQLAKDWGDITKGNVEVKVFHNGTAGNEDVVVQKLRANQLQAAVLSSFGLAAISPEIMTISCPFLIRNNEELDLVLREITKELEDRINTKGFFTLAWAHVGWVKFFSKAPIFVPADLKRQKLATNESEEKLNDAFKSMGFQMIPVQRSTILTSLSSGMVDAVFQSPAAVGSLQIFGVAKHMASINIAPFMGGIVLNKATWDKIPPEYKPRLIESARKNQAALDQEVRQLEENLISNMGKYGLTMNRLTPAQEQLWFDEIGRAMPGLIGTAFDRGIYGRIETILRNHRNGHN